MKKILVSIATTLVAATVLVACNGSGTNSSDLSSGDAAPRDRATCASLANWQSVGIGMSASQVQARLGAPAQITNDSTNTIYLYEACRGFRVLEKEAVPEVPATTPAVPAKPPEYGTINTSGSVTISGARGVLSVASPERIEEKVFCEWNYYDFPYAAGQSNRFCRTASNPF
jgi:hypothetical protein